MQLLNVKAVESLNVFEKCLYFVIQTLWNATAVAWLYATCSNPASQKRLGYELAIWS